MGNTGSPEFQFLGAHGGFKQDWIAFRCTIYAMAVLALQGGAREVESLKRRTVTAPDVTECYRVGIRSDGGGLDIAHSD